MKTIVSWNVNGVRAAAKKGLLQWLGDLRPDVFCLQEIKAHPEQLEPELLAPPGYKTLWMPAEKKGYSGVAAFVKK